MRERNIQHVLALFKIRGQNALVILPNERLRLRNLPTPNRVMKLSQIRFFAEIIKVLGDKDAIQRVVLNILDNAIKFSFENTKVLISTWYKDSKAYVSIGNFGTGIERNEINHIFDRFYKTDKSRSSDKKGAGLGLSMVKNIISLLGL